MQKLNMSWNSLESLPKEIYYMHWLKRLTIDNNRLTELGDDVGLLQGLEVFWFGMNQITRLPFAFGKMKALRDVMFLANPFEFPSTQDIMKGIEHVQWMCRQEGLKYFRGPPPKPKLLRSGIAEEGCMYESEFLKNLATKLKEAEDTGYLNLNFANMPVWAVLRVVGLLVCFWELPALRLLYCRKFLEILGSPCGNSRI
jgi:Leucine-rich repeat (LRR) protein